MNLTLTHDQLTPETIATILNSAYIKTEVVKRNEGREGEYQSAESFLDDLMFEIIPGLRDDIIFRAYMSYSADYDEERLRKAADYMDYWPVGSKYVFKKDDGRHLLSFHYNHVIPEDEAISSAYLVKLARYFVKEVGQHLQNWEAIESIACASA